MQTIWRFRHRMNDSDIEMISDNFQAENWQITAGINTHGSESIPEGVLARTDWVEASVTGRVNRNKRLYERDLWENVLNEERVRAKIEDANGLLGELDHPEYFEEKAKYAGIRTIGMRLNENDNMEIRFDILDTPAPGTGQVAYALVQAGVNLGVSSRGRGKLEKTEQDGEVFERVNPEHYQFATWDAVSGPGFATARVNQDQMSVSEAVQCIGEGCDREVIETAQNIYEDITGGMHRPGGCSLSESSQSNDNSVIDDDQVNPNSTSTSTEEDVTVGESNGTQSITEDDISVDEFRRLQNTVDTLSDKVNEKDQRLEEMEETIEEKDNQIARLEGEEAQEQVEALEEQVETLQEKLDLATEALEEYEDKEDTIENLKEANITQEEKLALAYETIERQDEALELASETINKFKEHYLTACDVMEQWQHEDEEMELREHMEQRCREHGIQPETIPSVVESARDKQHFDSLLSDVLEARGQEADLKDIDESNQPEDEDIQEGAQRYQNGPSSNGGRQAPGLDDIDEQVDEDELEDEDRQDVSESNGPDKDRLKGMIGRVGSKK